jgi:hypothetical protein
VDGYNIIYAWEEPPCCGMWRGTIWTPPVTADGLDEQLQTAPCELILVSTPTGALPQRGDIALSQYYVVYTREAETATPISRRPPTRLRGSTPSGSPPPTAGAADRFEPGGSAPVRGAFRAEVEAGGGGMRALLRRINSHERSQTVAEAFRKAEDNKK